MIWFVRHWITFRRRVPTAPGTASGKRIPHQATCPKLRQSLDSEGLPLADKDRTDLAPAAPEELRAGDRVFEPQPVALRDLARDRSAFPSSYYPTGRIPQPRELH